MTTMSKFLALIPVVAFAAGCHGAAPSGPGPLASNDATEAVSGGVTTMGRACLGLKAVDLTVVDSDDSILWVKATYVYLSGPTWSSCAPPEWTANRDDLIVDKANRFRAGFFRFAGGSATVTATAPNGVHNRIEVNLGPATTVTAPSSCDAVSGVSVTLDPSGDDTDVRMIATYAYLSPVATPCGVAPAWYASRRGLRVNPKDPFRASIPPLSFNKTTVTATAPNGAVGGTTF